MTKIKLLIFLVVACSAWSNVLAATFLEKNRQIQLAPSQQRSLSYRVQLSCLMTVRVHEMFGKNIKFNVLHDGKQIFTSDVQRGHAKGTVRVAPGIVSVVLVNGHMFSKKNLLLTISVEVLGSLLHKRDKFRYISKNKLIVLSAGNSYSTAFDVHQNTTLFVKVSESFGANIKFRILQDGRIVYRSGIKRGGGQAFVSVIPGKVSVVIINGNIFSKKNTYLTIGFK